MLCACGTLLRELLEELLLSESSEVTSEEEDKPVAEEEDELCPQETRNNPARDK